jgi:hypothetical protein
MVSKMNISTYPTNTTTPQNWWLMTWTCWRIEMTETVGLLETTATGLGVNKKLQIVPRQCKLSTANLARRP